MAQPTHERLSNFRQGDLSARMLFLELPHAPGKAPHVFRRQKAILRKNDLPQKSLPAKRRTYLAFLQIELDPKIVKKILHRGHERLKTPRCVIETGGVVDVAQIEPAAQLFFHEMVEGIEINIGEELAGQISNRQAAPALQRRKQIIAGEVPVDFQLRVAAVDDSVDEPQRFGVADDAANFVFQNFVIDAGKIMAEVAFKNISRAVHELLQSANGGVRAFADAIGIAVKNEPALEERADDVDEHVVHNAIAKVRGADQTLLRLINEESAVIAGLIREGAQLAQKLQRVVLERVEKFQHVRAEPFTLRGFMHRQ